MNKKIITLKIFFIVKKSIFTLKNKLIKQNVEIQQDFVTTKNKNQLLKKKLILNKLKLFN